MYENELKALKKAGRFRERILFDDRLEDLASNDYLGLSQNKKQFNKAVKLVKEYQTLSSKASMLVNGYHPVHRIFEMTMAEQNGFEEGLVVGSGFLANMSLIEALVRKGDMLFMDEAYHASGVMAAQLLGERVVTFRHNDVDDLREKLSKHPAKRRIIAVEGVYSMGGDLCKKEIFDLADEFEALMIVDEAHSAGVLGKKLLGIFEYYGITINERHIKMGTLGKAYGSYGAYILASSEIISFLVNRAKPIIYSTAPSVFDTALALVSVEYVRKNAKKYRKKIAKRQQMVKKFIGTECKSLILPMVMPTNEHTQFIQKGLMQQGYLVGAIRQPTVQKPIMRVILNVNVPVKKIKHALALIRHNTVK
ncbi:pyridoxal phosphate-dependent aminotransferase family protein [Sulfurovum sp.]|uniref:aminotransferase class I/II-fold pyridoxal phosphate-dependent enzyme n=1 Tax=Sulfurovum sp. TaxID=1969726 RepID=UPI0025E745A2|nr:pyridoxal phosphate-dependent aminotransferase family protein [Sulfurovum sp.]